MSHYCLEVVRDDLGKNRIVDLPEPEVGDGQAVIRVDRFGLTANNITYGVAGDIIGYWQFFPSEGQWGRIPVWGIGTVVDAGSTGLKQGDEYYGYYPMASYLVVEPENVSARGFVDGTEHRAALPPAYNQYSLMTPENGFDRSKDSHRMVYFPLFATGFILDDYLDDNDSFGAEKIIISSASSKTSFSLAFMLNQRDNAHVVGLTSAGNKAFVESMGIYDEVVTYDDIESMDAGTKITFVDMAGNRQVLSRLHHHFGDNVVCSCGVGITHYDARGGEDPATLPGAKPSMFFAPTQMQKRNKDWGPEVYMQKMNDAWASFLTRVDSWVTINERNGQDGMKQTYEEVLKGAAPDQSFAVKV